MSRSRKQKTLDIALIVILRCDTESVLPDLAQMFGYDALVEFLRRFAGRTVKVPSVIALEKALRDVEIYLDIERAKGEGGRAKAVRNIVATYSVSRQRVFKIHKSVAETLSVFDLKSLEAEGESLIGGGGNERRKMFEA